MADPIDTDALRATIEHSGCLRRTNTLALLDEVDRLRSERDALAALIDWLSPMVATDSRDWAKDPTDAMVYEVVFGWGDARAEVEERHGGWPRHPGRLDEQGDGT